MILNHLLRINMKKLLIYISFTTLINQAYSQIGPNDANALLGLPTATDLTEINNISTPQIGATVYNLADDEIYRFTSTGWQIDSDNQTAQEVPLVTNVDVNGVPTDPTPVNETNLEEVVQAIAPITSKAGRVFYPPSIEIDASTNGTFMVNLYDQYTAQFNGAGLVASSTDGGTTFAPEIPVYAATELYYYVTFADPAVFGTITIDGNTGEMTYQIIGQPTDFNSLINVVFVVK